MSAQASNDSYIINVWQAQTSEKEIRREAFAKESESILNELNRIIRVLVGIEKDLANELPRYVSDTDFYKADAGLEPPKKRSKRNGEEMC
jgi:hypothetical protein